MRNRLLLLTWMEGGLVMLLETASPSVVAPILGHSVMVWAVMLSLSVGALALGYFLGSWFTRKERSYAFLMKLFMVNGFLILSGYMLLYLQNGSDSDLVSAFFSYTIISFVLVLPLILFGSSTPVIIALIQREQGDRSGVVGRMFSNSTFGGIIFSLVTGYWLIDLLGVGNTVLLAVVLSVSMPLSYFISIRRIPLAGNSGAMVLGSFVLMTLKPDLPETGNFKTLHFSEGITGQLIVADFREGNQMLRTLLINRMGQTKFNMDEKCSGWPYVDYLTSAASIYPPGSKTLVLGLGGGVAPRQIAYSLGHSVDAVELDQRIIDLSERFFDFWPARITTYSDDARRYVKKYKGCYDFIVLDIFNGEIMPSHGLSVEAFSDIDRILKPGGLVAINFNGFLSGKEGTAGRSLIRTIEAAGFNVALFDCGAGNMAEKDRNLLYFAYKEAPKWQKTRAFMMLAEKEYRIDEHLMSMDSLPQGESYVITDDKPVLEYINRYAADIWRKDYLNNYTRKFKKDYQLPLVR